MYVIRMRDCLKLLYLLLLGTDFMPTLKRTELFCVWEMAQPASPCIIRKALDCHRSRLRTASHATMCTPVISTTLHTLVVRRQWTRLQPQAQNYTACHAGHCIGIWQQLWWPGQQMTACLPSFQTCISWLRWLLSCPCLHTLIFLVYFFQSHDWRRSHQQDAVCSKKIP